MVVILTLINNFYFSKKAKNNYTLQIIILAFLMLTFTYEACTILTITCTILAIAIQLIFTSIAKVKQKKIRVNDTEEYKVPIGFYLCVSNIIMLIITNMQIFYRG